MMDDDFNYPHEPAKFNMGTWMMSAEEKGAYIVLINLIYLGGGPIENHTKNLARAVGCSMQAFRRILGRLTGLGKISITQEGLLTNSKCERVIAKRIRISEKRSESGQKGGEKSAENRRKLTEKVAEIEANSANNNDLVASLLDHKEKKREDNSTHSPSVSVTRARGTRLPEGWRPSADDWQLATSLGLNPEYTLAKFTDHWRSQPGKNAVKLDWGATWRNWCRRDAEKKGAKPPANTGLPLLSAIQGGKAEATDPNDSWGIQAWCASEPKIIPLPDTVSEDAKNSGGKWYYSGAGGKIIDLWAEDVAQAAGWKPTWRNDWSLALEWIDLDIPLEDVCATVRRLADYFRGKGNPALTLRAFDQAIRDRKAAA